MQIYIHVPFCRKKCHYCGFYSIPTGSTDGGDGLALPKENTEALAASSGGINIFSANKNIEEATRFLGQKDSKQIPSSQQSPIIASNTVKSLSSLIPNLSHAGIQESQGVQSLSDILRSKKNSNISTSLNTPQAIGPTLADALLPPDQARSLRESLAVPQLKIENPAMENAYGLSSLLKDTSNSHTSLLTAQTMNAQAATSIQSLFLGQTLHHDELNLANENIRSALSGANINTFDKASRLPLPLPLPKGFVDNNTLSQDPLYQLWKKGILTEIKILSEFYAHTPVTSIFFGGGTPSLIPIKDMDVILRTLLKTFHVTHNAEISMEANPESITKEKSIAYSRMGFNRISLGIQSLQDSNLKTMGRVHSSLDAIKAFNALRDARFHNISIDFMWGLPNQTNKLWRADIKDAIALNPEHISCYGLSIDEGSLFEEQEKNGTLTLPSEKEQTLMYRTSTDLLEDAGYLQYEISNFSKIGYQCRHNLGYWQGADYMGLGPSAASTINNIRRTHASSIIEWAQDIQRGNLAQDIRSHSLNESSLLEPKPNFNTEVLSIQDRTLELIMLRLRTTKGLAFSEYKELTGRSFMKDHKTLIHTLDKHNLLRTNKGYVFLTPNGMLVSTSILEKFFESTKDILKHAL